MNALPSHHRELGTQQVLASADPTRRPLGETKLRDVTVDRVAAWSQGNEQALAPSTAKLALIALNQMFRFAVRRGWTGVNPVMQLEPGEKPRWRVEHVRTLEGGDLGRLLAHSDAASRPLFEFLAYTGPRIGEALGLRWCDVDFEAAVLHVRQQLSRQRTPKHLKTDASRREVVLARAVTRLLRERRLASAYKGADQLVFCKANGEGADYRDARKTFRAAVKAAGPARTGAALAALAAPFLRVAAHRQPAQSRVRLAPARALQPDDHARGVRAGRRRRGGEGGAGGELPDDDEHHREVRLGPRGIQPEK